MVPDRPKETVAESNRSTGHAPSARIEAISLCYFTASRVGRHARRMWQNRQFRCRAHSKSLQSSVKAKCVEPSNPPTLQPSNPPTLQPSNPPTLQPSNPPTLQPSCPWLTPHFPTPFAEASWPAKGSLAAGPPWQIRSRLKSSGLRASTGYSSMPSMGPMTCSPSSRSSWRSRIARALR